MMDNGKSSGNEWQDLNDKLATLRAENERLRAALRDISRRTRRGDPLGEIATAALKGGDADGEG